MHNRLKQFLAAENITQAQFASTIGIGKANISHVLSGRNKPGYDFIKAIMVGYPHLNINWLMVGNGKMYTMTQSAQTKIVEESSLLFDDEPMSLFSDEAIDSTVSLVQESSDVQDLEETQVLTSIKGPVNNTQIAVNQRKVSKIIVLFDDGSFQEM